MMYRSSLFALVLVSALGSNGQVCSVTITHEVSGDQVQFFGTSPDNPTQWSWFFNGGTPLTSNLQNPVVTYNTPGQYIAALTVSGGPNSCSASLSSDIDTVTITATALPDPSHVANFVRYTSAGSIELSAPVARQVSMRLCDVTGRYLGLVFTGTLPAGRSSYPLPTTLRSGMHMLTITDAKGSETHRFVVERTSN